MKEFFFRILNVEVNFNVSNYDINIIFRNMNREDPITTDQFILSNVYEKRHIEA